MVQLKYNEYDVCSNIISQIERTPNLFKYAGEVYDAETSLYYLRVRYYDPSIERFLNEDTYEENNQLQYTDPSGHMTIEDSLSSYNTIEKSNLLQKEGF